MITRGFFRFARQACSVVPVLPVLDQIIDHGGFGQRRGVTQRAEFVLGDLAQDAAHDLARTGLGQAGGELDQVWRGDRPDSPLRTQVTSSLRRASDGSSPAISVT